MKNTKQYFHPLYILLEFYVTLRNFSVAIIYFILLKYDVDSSFYVVMRYFLYVYLTLNFLYIVIRWMTTSYIVNDGSIQIDYGVISRQRRNIPLSKIQNVRKQTPTALRLFNVTSVTLETGSVNKDAAIKLSLISDKQAESITCALERTQSISAPETSESVVNMESETSDSRKVHFTAAKENIIKASSMSLQFLAIVPILASIYYKINDFFNIESKVNHWISNLLTSWISIVISTLIFVIMAILVGIVITYFRYGNFKVSSNEEYIFIQKGVLNEQTFSIAKRYVQAIQIEQTFMKRLLGLAEIKYVIAGEAESEEDKFSSLYPFIPIKKAYQLVNEITPNFMVVSSMERLPKSALWMKFLRIPWVWIIYTVFLIILNINLWWSVPIFVITYGVRFLRYLSMHYLIQGEILQFKSGLFSSNLFITRREKVIRVILKRSWLQKHLKLASITTVNRSKPVHFESIQDIPYEFGKTFIKWFEYQSTKSIENNSD
ncbi:PH domain-containing protein [Lentibacillus cibarius]|uniref:PH domain-containing protein n=1 Tax=Lentibacillus cibarius TaxID=2583219 RepID=A0A549YGM5_9BACI|nr:PH domain-containing protein [Lentibacillus cibarius]TRM11035.1 PH domain-containing protein [Lentibacillus cibarius]